MVQNTLFHFRSVVEKLNSSAKKQNSGAKTKQRYENTEQWYKIHCSVFVLLWENGTEVQKKNGTVVRKHTVPFLFRCGKNGTVVEKQNSGTKTRNGGTKYTVPFLFHYGKTEQ